MFACTFTCVFLWAIKTELFGHTEVIPVPTHSSHFSSYLECPHLPITSNSCSLSTLSKSSLTSRSRSSIASPSHSLSAHWNFFHLWSPLRTLSVILFALLFIHSINTYRRSISPDSSHYWLRSFTRTYVLISFIRKRAPLEQISCLIDFVSHKKFFGVNTVSCLHSISFLLFLFSNRMPRLFRYALTCVDIKKCLRLLHVLPSFLLPSSPLSFLFHCFLPQVIQ